MTESNIYTRADYADALLSAKRGKSILFVLILLLLLIQLALFFVGRYSTALTPTTNGPPWPQFIQYVIGLVDFLGLILPVVLGVVLLLIIAILLVGRLLGSGKLVSAFLWSVVLVMLLFPWQSMLNNPIYNHDMVNGELGIKIPGVLYTWVEYSHKGSGVSFDSTFDSSHAASTVLHWARFVVFPLVAVLILLTIQMKSDRGLRQALGTDIVAPTETTPPVEGT
jgi:hypothetical protein